jgi:hypothetical protein
LGQVVSMIMDGSSIVHVARYPNIIKRDWESVCFTSSKCF